MPDTLEVLAVRLVANTEALHRLEENLDKYLEAQTTVKTDLARLEERVGTLQSWRNGLGATLGAVALALVNKYVNP